MHKNDLSNHVTHLFGDPTLALRPKPVLNQPKLTLDKTFVDFGTVVQGSKPTDYIRFDNDGLSPVTISFKKAPFSIDGRGVVIGYWDVFYYKHPDTGQMFRTIEIPPGQSKMVPFTFFPRSDGPVGAYSMIMLFQTNDPAYPYIKIRLAGVARVPEIKE